MVFWIGIISAYFVTGAVLSVTGPLARKRRRDVQTTEWRHLFTDPPIPQWKFTAFNLAIGALIVVLWPVGLASERGGSTEPDVESPEVFPELPAGLTFQLMGGVGRLQCADCGLSQEVLSFTHGFDGSHTAGHQCQVCGKFHAVDYEPASSSGTPESETQATLDAKLVCACGGPLSRDEIVVCPSCRSQNVSYNIRYLT